MSTKIEHLTFRLVFFWLSIYWFSLEEELEPVSALNEVILPVVGETKECERPEWDWIEDVSQIGISYQRMFRVIYVS